MTGLVHSRRRFLTGLTGLIAAPAIVKFSSLMPLSVPKPHRFIFRTSLPPANWRSLQGYLNECNKIYDELTFNEPAETFRPRFDWDFVND